MRFILVVFAMMLCAPAFAQDKGEPMSADSIIQDTDQTYERRVELATTMHEIWPVRLKVEQALDRAASRMPPSEGASFKSAMRQAIQFKKLEAESIQAMVDTFTVAELESMVEFYGSTTGRAVTEKTARYQSEIAPAFTRMMDKALMDIKTGSAPGNIQ